MPAPRGRLSAMLASSASGSASRASNPRAAASTTLDTPISPRSRRRTSPAVRGLSCRLRKRRAVQSISLYWAATSRKPAATLMSASAWSSSKPHWLRDGLSILRFQAARERRLVSSSSFFSGRSPLPWASRALRNSSTSPAYWSNLEPGRRFWVGTLEVISRLSRASGMNLSRMFRTQAVFAEASFSATSPSTVSISRTSDLSTSMRRPPSSAMPLSRTFSTAFLMVARLVCKSVISRGVRVLPLSAAKASSFSATERICSPRLFCISSIASAVPCMWRASRGIRSRNFASSRARISGSVRWRFTTAFCASSYIRRTTELISVSRRSHWNCSSVSWSRRASPALPPAASCLLRL